MKDNTLPKCEHVLYGVKKGNEDWQEEILSTQPAYFARVQVVAERDGYHKFRTARIDLTAPPDFSKTVK